jgi:hypothetical protein
LFWAASLRAKSSLVAGIIFFFCLFARLLARKRRKIILSRSCSGFRCSCASFLSVSPYSSLKSFFEELGGCLCSFLEEEDLGFLVPVCRLVVVASLFWAASLCAKSSLVAGIIFFSLSVWLLVCLLAKEGRSCSREAALDSDACALPSSASRGGFGSIQVSEATCNCATLRFFEELGGCFCSFLEEEDLSFLVPDLGFLVPACRLVVVVASLF